MLDVPKVILLVENSRGFGRALLRGIARYSRLHGPWTFYRMPAFYRDPGARIRTKELHRMKKWGATGIIMREIKNNEELIGLGLPTIVSTYVNETIPGVCEIYVDNRDIGRMAAEHLLELGFKQFAFCGYDDFFWSRERWEGFTKRIEEAGFSTYLYEQPKSQVKRLWDNEQIILADWLKSLPKPVGLMACIDERSQEVLEACKTAGLHVPEETALVGGDNDDLICDLANPPLSSVAISGERAGYEAAKLLGKLMKGEEKKANQKILVEPTYVAVRQSTDILAIEDKDVAHAVRFIRQHSKEPIQVPQVAEAVCMGRRSLEKRFRQFLGWSVYEQIRRARINEVTQMLVETNLSISEIALNLGYSMKNVARSFRKEKGMSLQAYRKMYGSKLG